MQGARGGTLQSGRAPDRRKVPPGFFKLLVYNNIAELGDVTDFLPGVTQSPLDRFFSVPSPPPKPVLQLLQDRGRRNDEKAHRTRKGLAYRRGAPQLAPAQ